MILERDLMIFAFLAGAAVLGFGVLIGISVAQSNIDKILNNRND